MRVLLDTHIYLWWLLDSPRIPGDAAEVIADPSTIVCVSAASIWEASIKAALGRLDLDGIDLVAEVAANNRRRRVRPLRRRGPRTVTASRAIAVTHPGSRADVLQGRKRSDLFCAGEAGHLLGTSMTGGWTRRLWLRG